MSNCQLNIYRPGLPPRYRIRTNRTYVATERFGDFENSDDIRLGNDAGMIYQQKGCVALGQ